MTTKKAAKPEPKKTKELDVTAIIARGYAFEEEYQIMNKSGKLEKVNLGERDPVKGQVDVEGIWTYPLEPSDKPGTTFRFVLFNDPVFTRGPRPLAGMVGIAHATGTETRGIAYTDECIAMFKKAGQAAIDYHKSVVKKHESKYEVVVKRG